MAQPDLEPIARAIAEMDGHQAEVLERLHREHYADASPTWQLRWHVLRCEAASLISNSEQVQRQVNIGTALAEHGHPLATGYLQACLGGMQLTLDQKQHSLTTLDKVVSQARQLGDDSLLTLALARRGNTLGDMAQLQRAIEDLHQAILINEVQSSSGYFHISQGLLNFSLARGFFYLENMSKADEIMKKQLKSESMDPALRWFLQFNYAVMLDSQGRTKDATTYLLLAGDPPEYFDGVNRGYAHLFTSRVLVGLGHFHQAKEAGDKAVALFETANQPMSYNHALMYRGQARIKMGDQGGWSDLDQAVAFFEQQPSQANRLITLLQWMTEHHVEAGEWELAFNRQLQQQSERLEQLEAKHSANLATKQAELLDTVDRQRQRLADSGETSFQLRQQLLMWQSACILLGLTILGLGLWKLWPRTRQPVLYTVPGNWRKALEQLLARGHQREQTLALVLVRSQKARLDDLMASLEQELRPGDLCLTKEPHCWLLALPGASANEVKWRMQFLATMAETTGITDLEMATVQPRPFEDIDTLISKLRYKMLHQKVDGQRQAEAPVTT